MKKITTVLLVCVSCFVFSQSMQVQNMSNYLRSKDYAKAKASADAAAENESTKTSSKMWMVRGSVYLAIASDTAAAKLDPQADEKAMDAYINCMKYDKSDIYKEDPAALGNFGLAVNRLNHKAQVYAESKNPDAALKCYDLLEAAIPYDTKGALKAAKITKSDLIAYRFDIYRQSGNKEKIREYADKLIEGKFNDPRLYVDMARMSMGDKDTTRALNYIDKGRALFPDNMPLITTELDIYIARKKTDVLKDKLTAALAASPKNEVLHLVLANLYKSTNQFENAEAEYKKSLEIKPDYEAANYNLGVLYYSEGKSWNDKLNALPPKDPKTKEYETKTNDYFKKAIPPMEASYAITPDKRTKQVLRQLALRVGDTERAEKYK